MSVMLATAAMFFICLDVMMCSALLYCGVISSLHWSVVFLDVLQNSFVGLPAIDTVVITRDFIDA